MTAVPRSHRSTTGYRTVSRALLSAIVVAITSLRAFAAAPATIDPNPTLDEVLTQLQRGLVKIDAESRNSGLPALASVTISLETELGHAADGTVNVYVATFGAKEDRFDHHKITLTLSPVAGGEIPSGATQDLATQLEAAVLAASRSILHAQDEGLQLTLSQLEAEFKFIVIRKGTAGVKFAIVPVTAGITGTITNKMVNTLKVVYKTKG